MLSFILLQYVAVDHTCAFVVQTVRTIQKGEEILVDYGKDWFEDSCPCQTCATDDTIGASSVPDDGEVKKRRLAAQSERNRRRRKAKKAARNAQCAQAP